MSAPHGLLRCDRPRQSRSSAQDDHHARWCLWSGSAVGSAADGTTMSMANNGPGRGNASQVSHTAAGTSLRVQQHGAVPLALEVIAMSKRFGSFVALDQVSM